MICQELAMVAAKDEPKEELSQTQSAKETKDHSPSQLDEDSDGIITALADLKAKDTVEVDVPIKPVVEIVEEIEDRITRLSITSTSIQEGASSLKVEYGADDSAKEPLGGKTDGESCVLKESSASESPLAPSPSVTSIPDLLPNKEDDKKTTMKETDKVEERESIEVGGGEVYLKKMEAETIAGEACTKTTDTDSVLAWSALGMLLGSPAPDMIVCKKIRSPEQRLNLFEDFGRDSNSDSGGDSLSDDTPPDLRRTSYLKWSSPTAIAATSEAGATSPSIDYDAADSEKEDDVTAPRNGTTIEKDIDEKKEDTSILLVEPSNDASNANNDYIRGNTAKARDLPTQEEEISIELKVPPMSPSERAVRQPGDDDSTLDSPSATELDVAKSMEEEEAEGAMTDAVVVDIGVVKAVEETNRRQFNEALAQALSRSPGQGERKKPMTTQPSVTPPQLPSRTT